MVWAAPLSKVGAEELPLVPFGADAIQYLSPGLADAWPSRSWQCGRRDGREEPFLLS